MIRRAAVDGKVTQRQFTAYYQGRPSANTILNRFGRWSTAVRRAGCEPGTKYQLTAEQGRKLRAAQLEQT